MKKIFFVLLCLFQSLMSLGEGYVYLKTLSAHTDKVTFVSFDASSSLVASGDNSGHILIWDVASGLIIQTLEGHSGMITDLQFNTQQSLLASASYDGTVKLWDLENGRIIHSWDNPEIPSYNNVNGNEPTFVRFSPDENFLFFGGYNMKLVKAHIQSNLTQEVYIGRKYGITSAEFTHNNKYLAFAYGGEVAFLNLSNNQVDASKTIGRHGDFEDFICEIAFTPEKKLMTTWTVNGRMNFWSYMDGQFIRAIQAADTQGSSMISFSTKGRYVLTGNMGSKTRLWDMKSLKVSQELEEHISAVKTFSFSPDSRYIATGSDDNSVKIWYKPISGNIDNTPFYNNDIDTKISENNTDKKQSSQNVPIVDTPNHTISNENNDVLNNNNSEEEIKDHFVLENVLFVQSESIFLAPDQAAVDLRYIVRIMNKYPTMRIQLQGHTDNVGPAYNNLILSEHRVEAVKRWIVEHGIQEDRIETFGYGELRPKKANNNEENRQKNRRVEVQILRR